MKGLIVAFVGCGAIFAAQGAKDVVKASSFGWDANDATKCLRAAINSGAKQVIVDKQSGDWIVSKTIYLASNQELVFEDGVVVQAKKGAFQGITEALFSARFVTNVVMRGEGKAVLRMCMPDYIDETKYKKAEWRHGISTLNPVNLTIRNLTVEASGGDGVYVNGAKNMLVENVVSSGNCRQGVSVISTDGLVIRNCVFKKTKGELPECGIDIEPHIASCYVKNVLIEKCQFLDNNCHGIAMNLSGLGERSGYVSIKVKDCEVTGNKYHGIWMILSRNTHLPPKGEISFENVRTKNNGSCPLSVENLSAGSYQIRFKDCDFDGMSTKGGIQFTTATDLADVTFDNCTLRIHDGVAPAKFIGSTGSGITGLRGNLKVVTEKGESEFDLAKWGKAFVSKPELRAFRQNAAFDIKALYPISKDAALDKSMDKGWSAVVRGTATLMVRAPAKGEHKLYVRTARIGPKWGKADGQLTVYDAQGTTHDMAAIKPMGAITEYTLKSQGPNMYTIKLNGGHCGVQYKSTFSGTAILCANLVDFIAAQNKEMYFAVPAGSKEVKIEFTMAPGEPMSGRLINAKGEEVAKVEAARQRAILAAHFPPTTAPEVWCLKMDNFVDDGIVRVGGDALPLLSPTAKEVLTIVTK